MLPPAVRCVTHCSFGGKKDDGLRDDGLINVLAYILWRDEWSSDCNSL